jgi:probable F420-dependent oxidoreductase
MRFALQFPVPPVSGSSAVLFEPESVKRITQAAERAGFGAITFTEHPAPSRKWVEAGGHGTFDPLNVLAFCAGITQKIRLVPYLLVLPYRNPFLLAKTIATLDVLSEGRLTLAVGTGYLRSEFAALGVDFERRNALFDESISVLRHLWRDESYRHDGIGFTALDQSSLPPPRQLPCPPIWIGGNSQRSRARVASVGDGWAPVIKDEARARWTRTAPLESVDKLRTAIAQVRAEADSLGRNGARIDVLVSWAEGDGRPLDFGSERDRVRQLDDAGATWLIFSPPSAELDSILEAVVSYGEHVISALGGLTAG